MSDGTTLGVEDMRRYQLDGVAEAGGIVGRLPAGSERGYPPENRHGYGFAWVRTDDGGGWNLVLVGRSSRTRQLLRAGRARMLIAELGVDAATAANLARAGEVRFGRELEVLRYVLETRERFAAAWEKYPARHGFAQSWHREHGLPPTRLSSTRLTACAAVIKRLRRIEAGLPV